MISLELDRAEVVAAITEWLRSRYKFEAPNVNVLIQRNGHAMIAMGEKAEAPVGAEPPLLAGLAAE